MQKTPRQRHFQGRGFLADDAKSYYMTRCHDCGYENYAMAVSSGQCAWCGCQIYIMQPIDDDDYDDA